MTWNGGKRVFLCSCTVVFWCSQVLADMSYTIQMQIENKQYGLQSVTQRCKTNEQFLLTETQYSAEEGAIVQLTDMKRGVIYSIDHKEQRITMSPIPDEELPELDFNAEKMENSTIRGFQCQGYRIQEFRGTVPSATMEVWVTDDLDMPFGSLWKDLLKDKSKALKKLRDNMDGFPLRYTRRSLLEDKTQVQMEVMDIELSDLPEEIFTLPETYTLHVAEEVSSDTPEEL